MQRCIVAGVGESAPLAVRTVGAAVHRQHDHLGAAVDSRIEIGDVFVGKADATGRHPGADGPRRVGAVNAIDRAAEINRTGAERIAWPPAIWRGR